MNPNTQSDSGTAIKVSPATAGSFILLVSFFLPWIEFFGGNVSGLDLHQVWSPGRFVWVIPAVALCAIMLGLSGRRNVEVAQIAGFIPFIFLGLAIYESGPDILKAILFGGYLTLLSGLFLLCVVPRMAPRPASTAAEVVTTTPTHESEDNR